MRVHTHTHLGGVCDHRGELALYLSIKDKIEREGETDRDRERDRDRQRERWYECGFVCVGN